jgi:hypothetical protein
MWNVDLGKQAQEFPMLSREERERLTEVQEDLLKLYVLRRHAFEDGDVRRARTIEKEIAPLERERQSIRRWDTVGATWAGGRAMDRSAARRRHVREKSIIDHVARDLFKPPPEPAAEKSDKPRPTTDTGLSIEEQVRKEWDPSKGGRPTFLV